MWQFTVVKTGLFSGGDPFGKIGLQGRVIEGALFIHASDTDAAPHCLGLRRIVDPPNNRRLAKNFDLPFGLKFESLEAFRNQSRVTQPVHNFNLRSRVEWLRDRLQLIRKLSGEAFAIRKLLFFASDQRK